MSVLHVREVLVGSLQRVACVESALTPQCGLNSCTLDSVDRLSV